MLANLLILTLREDAYALSPMTSKWMMAVSHPI